MAIAGRAINRLPQGGARRGPVSKTQSIPAPVGGLNAVDSLAAMPPQDAVILDNWFPQPGYVELRNGYTKWATGLPGWAETVMPWNGTAEKLFAFSGTAVYDVTAGGAVGAAVVTGLTNARWEWTNVSTAGGFFTYAANGVDDPLLFDGSTWTKITGISSPAITGVTTTELCCPVVWKNRVWFIQVNTMSAWYLPTASIGGAASEFPLGAIFRQGGTLALITTASLTNGSNFDDYIIFVSSEGEVAIYGGDDPAQAGLFNLQGIYPAGKLLSSGRRAAFRFGNDCIILTTDGFISLQKIIAISFLGKAQTISEKITNSVQNATQSYSGNFGWEGIVYPSGNKIIINVPTLENISQYQYVQNTITGAWSTFGLFNSPWNFCTYCRQNENLYAGGDTYVALADQGQIDDTNQIIGSLQAAFTYLGSNTQKMMKQVRPILQVTGPIGPVLGVSTDFDTEIPTNIPTFGAGAGSPWNTSPWNTSPWQTGFFVQKTWQGVQGLGFAISLNLVVASNAAQVRFLAYDYIYEAGGPY